MNFPKELRYSREHEWVRVEGNRVTVGITDYAQSQLGDVVFVEIPAVGGAVAAGKTFSVVESVKAVSDIYAPVSGSIVAVNEELADTPEVVNSDPYGKGWIAVIELANPAEINELMDSDAYAQLAAGGGH